MPKYVTNTKTFIAPHLLDAGTLINYNGPPGPHLDPVDDEAKNATFKYYQDNPHARIGPIEALPVYGVEVLAPPVIPPSAIDVGILGNPGPAQNSPIPGPDSQAAVVRAAQLAAQPPDPVPLDVTSTAPTPALDALKAK